MVTILKLADESNDVFFVFGIRFLKLIQEAKFFQSCLVPASHASVTLNVLTGTSTYMISLLRIILMATSSSVTVSLALTTELKTPRPSLETV